MRPKLTKAQRFWPVAFTKVARHEWQNKYGHPTWNVLTEHGYLMRTQMLGGNVEYRITEAGRKIVAESA